MLPELESSLPESFTMYAVPQTLYKVHPDFDALLKRLLQADNNGYVFVPRGNLGPLWVSSLNERLMNSLGAEMFSRVRRLHPLYILFRI